MKALINIDYTNDFVAENGALTCGEPGQAIEEEIIRLAKKFIDQTGIMSYLQLTCIKKMMISILKRNFTRHIILKKGRDRLYGELQDVWEESQERPQCLLD